MARESRAAGARMRTGICLQDDCELAKTKEKQTVRMGHDFVCKQCGAELHEVKATPTGPNMKLIGGIIAGVLVVGGGAAALFMGGGEEQATVDKLQKEDPQVTTVDIQQLSFTEPNITVAVDGNQLVTLSVTPENADETLTWSSSDEAVATVTDNVVKGIAPGKATITVESDRTHTKATLEVTVNKGEGKGGGTTGGNTDGIVTKDLGYAVYKGMMKNGKMNDNNGVLTFKQKHIIEPRDVKKRMAEPGEKVIGIFEDGHLTTGTWYKNDGNKETIIP